MAMGNDYDQKTEPILKLCEILAAHAHNAKDRTEACKELVENEFIHDEMFDRLLVNEMLGLIKEIEDSLFLFKGLN